MARFKIYSKSGEVRYEGTPIYHGTYMSPSYLEFSTVSSPVPIAWEIGDYVEYSRTGLRYSLYSIPQPTKKATRDRSGESFVYTNVQFFDFTKMLDIAPFRDLVLDGTQYFFSSSKDITTYENVQGIADRIQRNLDDFSGLGVWDIRVAEGVEGIEEAKEFSVSGVSCLGALSQIYEVWDTIGWAYSVSSDGKYVITIGAPNIRSGANTTDEFRYGFGNGLTAIRKTQTNLAEMATRLYVFGSTKNMVEDYYRNLNIHEAGSVHIPNLMLPVSTWGHTDGLPDASKSFIEDIAAQRRFGIIPRSIYFDGSEYDEIYPTIGGTTIGQLKAAKDEIGSSEYYPQTGNDSLPLDAVLEVTDAPTDDGYEGDNGSRYVETANVELDEVAKTSLVPFFTDEVTFASHRFSHTGRANVENTVQKAFFFAVPKSVSSSAFSLSVSYAVYSGDTLVGDYRVAKGTGVEPVGDYNVLSFSLDPFSFGTKQNPVVGTVIFKVKFKFSTNGPILPTMRYGVNAGSMSVGLRKNLNETFGIRIPQVGFDLMKRASLAGSQPSITFNDGLCGGRTFTVGGATYDATSDTWVLTVQRMSDTSTKMYYPNARYQVRPSDSFVFTGIAMPDEYIGMASQRLLSAAQFLLQETTRIIPSYEPSIDSKKVWEGIAKHPGNETYILREGKYFHLKDADVTDGDEYVIIDSLTINEGESNIPTYSVTLREEKMQSLVQTINRKISRLGGRSTSSVSTFTEDTPSSINGTIVKGSVTGKDLGLQDALEDAGSDSLPVYLEGGQGKPVTDVHVQGSVVGMRGVAAGGIVDPTSEGGGGDYIVITDANIKNLTREDTLTIPTAYALKVTRTALTAEEEARKEDTGILRTAITDEVAARTVTDGKVTTLEGKFVGNSAKQAIADGQGRNIVQTYSTKADTVTGLTARNNKLVYTKNGEDKEVEIPYSVNAGSLGGVEADSYLLKADAEVGHIDTMSYVTIEDDTIEIEPIPEDEVAAIFTL